MKDLLYCLYTLIRYMMQSLVSRQRKKEILDKIREHKKKGQKIFDSHFHIIDPYFPLVPSEGYVPEPFTCRGYLQRTQSFNVVGGAIVSGSFQGFDQTYLIEALKELGTNFVGVTQLPASVSEEEILRLDSFGVRAVRFNLQRGGSEEVSHLEAFAKRIYEVAKWHVELYIDSTQLEPLSKTLLKLPAVSIDHLGLTKRGFFHVLSLVEKGIKVKASGFGRVDFDIKIALKELAQANPKGILFGTDLPSTRAPRPFLEEDILLIQDALGPLAEDVFYNNAVDFYQPLSTS